MTRTKISDKWRRRPKGRRRAGDSPANPTPTAGKEVQVVLLADPAELRGDAAEMFRRMQLHSVVVRSSDDLKEKAGAAFAADVLVDAILGTGFRPPVSGIYAEAISAINASTSPVLAVDIPSGADADSGRPCSFHRA